MIDPDRLLMAVAAGHDSVYLTRLKPVLEDGEVLMPGEDRHITSYLSAKSGHITLEYMATFAEKSGYEIESLVRVCSLERFTGAVLGPEAWPEMMAVLAEENAEG